MPTEPPESHAQLLRQQTILAQFGEVALRSDSHRSSLPVQLAHQVIAGK